jgi:hypothetical protein
MPVSRRATTTPAPVRDDRSAPTAVTPHAVPVASVVPSSGSPTGWMSVVGMTGAMARTAGSRLSDRTSDLSNRSTSTRSPTEPRSGVSIDAAPPKGSPVLAAVRSRRTVYVRMLLPLGDVARCVGGSAAVLETRRSTGAPQVQREPSPARHLLVTTADGTGRPSPGRR